MQKIRTAIPALLFVAIVNSPAAQAQPPGSPNEPPATRPPAAPPPAAPTPQAPMAGNPPPDSDAAGAGNKDDDKGDDEANTAQDLRLSRRGLGMEPGALNFGDLVLPPPPGSQVSPGSLKANQINFHGYLRAPMLVGFGSGSALPEGVDHGVKLHSPPRVPDAAYTDWSYTNNLGGPWTELDFAYGTARVFGSVQLASYNLTDASFKDLTAQLGVNQAWVTVNLPDFFGDRGGLRWNIGGFSDGYGPSGRYDAGAYGTYLFGRTHMTGETVSLFYDLTDTLTLQFEHGIGARLNVFPYAPNGPMASYLPYGGPKQQLPTFLHHVHVGATLLDKFTLALHYLTSWTQAAETPMELDGRISTVGAELRVVDTRFGSGWLGFSHLSSTNAVRVGGTLEIVHSWEGWSLTENFFGEPDISSGTGTVNTLGWEYSFSLATFFRYPEPFYGQGPDVLVTLFGMYSSISSPDPTFAMLMKATSKLKAGTEVTYTPLRWLGAGFRFDTVQPNMNDARESFTEITPRILLRTDFVSNEQIILQYTHYWLNSRTKLSFPFDQMKFTPDENVVSLIATLWW
jgi:hypothetical protein